MNISQLDYKHYFLLLFTLLHFGFWRTTSHVIPSMDIIPAPIPATTLHALSFGDIMFPYRIMSFQLTNAGDTFGRNTRLLDYDPVLLSQWFHTLAPFDLHSNILPFLAANYFGQSKNTHLVRAMAEFLEHHSAHDLEKLWWWRIQAIYLAEHKLHDEDYAMRLATPLTNLKHVPIWVSQYPAFIHEKRGEMTEALRIIENILAQVDKIPPEELTFMRYFVEQRIKQIDNMNQNAAKRLTK